MIIQRIKLLLKYTDRYIEQSVDKLFDVTRKNLLLKLNY